MVHLVQQQSATGVDAYTQLAFIFFANTALPFLSFFTNFYDYDNDNCYDSCGLATGLVFLNYYFPALILYGFPFLFMGIYSVFGVGGGLVKWQILIGTRYLGLLYRAWGVFIGIFFVVSQWDFVFPVIFVIYSYLLDTAYTDLGYEAVKHVDPSWDQGPNTIYPFEV